MSEKEINEIRSQISDLHRKLKQARERLAEAQMRHHGVKIGDRIIVTKYKKEQEAIITGWGTAFNVTGEPLCAAIKKDGTAGKNSIGWFDSFRKIEVEQ